MPVIESNQLANGSWGPKWGKDGVRTYQIVKEAITDSDTDGGLDVVQTSGFPIQFVTTHPNDPDAYCISVEAEQDENDARYWILTYHYSTWVPEFATSAAGALPGAGSSGTPENPTNPIDRRPVIKLRNRLIKRLRFVDLDGNAFKNRAGSLFEAYTEEIKCLCIDVTRNVAEFDYDLLNECQDGVNEAAFIGEAEKKVWCVELEADYEYFESSGYWKIHGVFVVGNDDLVPDPTQASVTKSWWYDWRLNAGYDKLVSGTLRTIYLPNGQKPSRPQLLDINGDVAASGATPLYVGFRVKRNAPLHSLGLL